MIPFEKAIESRLVLFDGAMGTYIYQQGVFIDKCFDELNLGNPDLIRKIHREYLDAGALAKDAHRMEDDLALGRLEVAQDEILGVVE